MPAGPGYDGPVPEKTAQPEPEEPTMDDATNDQLQMRENVHLVLRGPDGEIKDERHIENLVTTVGVYGVMDQLLAAPAVGKPTHMAIGTGTNAVAAGDTALQTELDRNALSSKTRNNAVLTMVASWGTGDGTGAITEAGILNASSSGDLYSRAVFAVMNKGANDTLDITWTWTQAAT